MINIIHDYKPLPCPAPLLRKVAGVVYKRESKQRKTLSAPAALILCSDYVIRKLNRNFRGKDKPTDVLSFSYNDPDLLGEIYISLKRADVQARRYGVGYEEELSRLLTHGLLHLFGYDHIKKSEREIMEKREEEYFLLLKSKL